MVEAIRQGDIPGVQLRCRQLLAATPDESWSWLTDRATLERWLADGVEVGENGSLRLRSRADAGELEESAELIEEEAPRRRSFAFERLGQGWPTKTRLTFEITPTPTGTEISVFHEGFQNLPLSVGLTVWEAYRRRWRSALERLAGAIAA